MKVDLKEKTYNVRIILLVALVVFALIVTVSAIGVLTEEKPLEITNLDQVESGLSSGEVKSLEKFIWEDLRVSQEFGEDRMGVVALVRPSSFVEYDEGEIRHYDLIVDIDEFKQSLAVKFALKGEGFTEAPVIECVRPELMKYADIKCESGRTSSATVTVGRELPHYFSLESGEFVTVTLKNDGVREYLNVRVSSCGDDAVKGRALEAVKAWMRGLGYEPSDYEIKIPELCDGAAS